MLVCLCHLTGHGSSKNLSSWIAWKGRYTTCTQPISNGKGVFCANFSFRQEAWKPYRKAWYGECYNVPSTIPFPMKMATYDEGFDQTLGRDEKRFKVGHNGDNLMCPFQCDVCHFRNIQKQDYCATNVKDKLLVRCIWRASLETFWARESSTVRANLHGAKKLEGKFAGLLSLDLFLLCLLNL
jgi:hypothetical protein